MKKTDNSLLKIIAIKAPNTTPQFQGYVEKVCKEVLREIQKDVKNPVIAEKIDKYIK